MVQEKTLRRALLVAACALVFFFAWHAKTAGYSRSGAVQSTPSTAAKLWLSGQKIGIPPASSTAEPLLWAAVLCFFGMELRHEGLRLAFAMPLPSPRNLRHLYRFLRPPPDGVRIFLR